MADQENVLVDSRGHVRERDGKFWCVVVILITDYVIELEYEKPYDTKEAATEELKKNIVELTERVCDGLGLEVKKRTDFTVPSKTVH